MRLLIIGAGGVGGAMTAIAARRRFLTHLVIADVSLERAQAVARRARGASFSVTVEQLDASSQSDILALMRAHRVDAVMNACDPRFNPPIFAAALEAECVYLDTAMTLSKPHPTRPYELLGKPLGADQLSMHERWQQKNLLALTCIGVEPGLSDVFARYASDHLFSRIDEIGVRDGSNIQIDGYRFAPTFSIWTTIEECLNPPIVYERGRGHFTTRPFSEPEIFDFPEGIGPIECVNVEHEEVLLIPRHIDAGRVTFKYGLGEEFIDILKKIHLLGLDTTRKVRVGNVEVSPRDVVAALLPNPADLGERMHGKTCAGTWVRGLGPDGTPREVYLYHVVDNTDTMRDYGCQAVVWQTAVNPVVALELIATGVWKGAGVLSPEAFDPVPFLEMLSVYGTPYRLQERTVGVALARQGLGDVILKPSKPRPSLDARA
jgi:saccharopine dehydrogenase-like NADP-dependent oxidoreductase